MHDFGTWKLFFAKSIIKENYSMDGERKYFFFLKKGKKIANEIMNGRPKEGHRPIPSIGRETLPNKIEEFSS